MTEIVSYQIPEESKRIIKNLLNLVVQEMKILEKSGYPLAVSIEEMKNLLEHIYYTSN